MNHEIEYERDLAICNEATEGPWFVVKNYDDDFVGVAKNTSWTCLGIADMVENGDGIESRERRANYIARFNPAYVKPLLKNAHDGRYYKQRCEELESHLREYLALRDAPHAKATADVQVDSGYIDACHAWDERTGELLK